MPSLALACRLSAATAAIQSLFKRAKSIARRYNEPLLAIEDDFLELGPELIPVVSAYAFSPAANSTLTFSSNAMTVTATTGGPWPNGGALLTFVPGRSYVISANVSNFVTATTARIALGYDVGSGSITSFPFSGNGVCRFVFLPTVASAWVSMRVEGGAQGSSATFSNISVREILSVQVYQDSTGTLPATIGSPIGLLTDRAYGGELVSMNPPSTSSTTGWFAYLSTISSNGSALTVTNTSANEGYAYCLQGSILAGRTYEVDIEILSRTHFAGTLQIGQTTTVLSVGRFTRTVTATNTHGVWVGVGSTIVGNQVTFILHSVRELKGNHATQATAGNRPIISQVPKRLGVDIVPSSASGWVFNTASLSGGQIVVGDTGGVASIVATGNIPAIANAFYQITYRVVSVAGSGVSVYVGGTPTTVRSAPGLYSETFKATNTGGVQVVARGPSGVTSAVIDNISVREVFEWTPAISFNGTTNSLKLATNPIGSNLSQPYTIVVAGVVGELGATRTMLANGGAVGWRITSAGKLGVLHNGAAGLNGSSTLSQGEAFVAEFVWDGSTATIRHNGAVVFSGALGVATLNRAGELIIGRFSSSAYFNGQLTAVTAFARVLSDSERTTIGKAFAKELGVTYLG